MIIIGYLIINNKGTCRFVKTKPGTHWNEISMKINVEVPDSLFNKPMLEANIKLEGDFEHKFDMEVKKNLQELIDLNENMHLVNVNILPKEETNDKL